MAVGLGLKMPAEDSTVEPRRYQCPPKAYLVDTIVKAQTMLGGYSQSKRARVRGKYGAYLSRGYELPGRSATVGNTDTSY